MRRLRPSASGLVLSASAVRATLVAAAFVLGAATVAGLVRVLPWFAAPGVPLGVVIPFARGLLAVGLETALLCAPPIGWALAASHLVDRGEARALFAIGAGPWKIARTTILPALLFAAFAAVAALAWGKEARAPGRLGRDLLQSARASCTAVAEPRALRVPFLRASWICFPHAPPRIAGPLPGGASGMFSAAGLYVSDDLREVTLADLRMLFGPSGSIHVQADRAVFTNMALFARASNLPPAQRSALLSLTGAALALAAAWAVLRSGRASRLYAVAVGAAGPVGALLALTLLEKKSVAPSLYLCVPAAAFAALLLVAVAWRALRRA